MIWEIWPVFIRAFESLKIATLVVYFCQKYEMYELKICRAVMRDDKKKWCKIWRGTDLSFQNWYEEFDEFWPGHWEVSKNCTLMLLGLLSSPSVVGI